MASDGLDKELKSIFDGAEVQPPESVWNAIESDLMVTENRRLRNTAIHYRRLAAACVLFALSVGAFSLYFLRNSRSPSTPGAPRNPATSAEKSNQHPEARVAQTPTPVTGGNRGGSGEAVASTSQALQPESAPNGKPARSKKNPFADAAGGRRKSAALGFAGRDDKAQAALSDPVSVSPPVNGNGNVSASPRSSDSPLLLAQVAPIVPKLADHITLFLTDPLMEEVIVKPDAVSWPSERRWIMLGASLGSFNPGEHFAPQPVRASAVAGTSAYAVSVNGQSSLGTATTYNVMIGQRISPRWVILAGINYLRERLGYTSTIVNSQTYTALSAPYYGHTPGQPVTVTNPYGINSVLEYITVPAQAGYVMVDKRIRLQTNAGIAGDIFVRNSVEDQTGHVNSFSAGPGHSSPYRSFNWEALVGEEVTYKLTPRYGVSVVPGFRYSLDPALKYGSGHPYVLDLNFRLRYIF
jgi:hypothetical protein